MNLSPTDFAITCLLALVVLGYILWLLEVV
jgi:hypothetical protein